MKLRHLSSSITLLLVLSASSNDQLELEKRRILSEKVEILLPKNFGLMSEELLKLKYPHERRPTTVFSNERGTVNVAFNHSTGRATPEQLPAYFDLFYKTFNNLHPSATWYDHSIINIQGKKFIKLELLTPAIDTRIYNLIFITDLDGRLLLCTFNCTEKEVQVWKPIAYQIMQSVKVL